MPRKRSSWFLSKRWRPNKWPFYILVGLELGLTIALLALFGIAAPNTYRTKLWQDGADNGFNSSPLTGLYAAANYRPYTTPMVWSKFLTNYNLVIVVLSMFFMLVKSIMYIVNVFPPILSTIVHAMLIALYTTSVYYQASSDTTDPLHPQNGPPWYITKSCSVAHEESNRHYCTQAKAAFAATTALLGILIIYFGVSIWSCLPSKTHREEVAAERKERDEKYSRLEAAHEEAKAAQAGSYGMPPETPGLQSGMNPMTPRTHAFNKLGGNAVGPVPSTRDVHPLRTHFSSPNRPTSPRESVTSQGGMRSPGNASFKERAAAQVHQPPSVVGASDAGASAQAQNTPRPGEPMFFPPPPKRANKK